MRREKLFSNAGFYPFIVESNVLLHREAIDNGRHLLQQLLKKWAAERTVHVLDLACGGEPVAIARIMKSFPDRRFHYTGIDINPDQVSLARSSFKFPNNVVDVKINEGNAWDFHPEEPGRKYDVIFMGLNLHHGTPEEIHYLATRISDLLSDDGIFINHDCFRPDKEPYLRRPDYHPENLEESFKLLNSETLSSVDALPVAINELPGGTAEPDWRKRYRQCLSSTATQRGGDSAGIESMNQHVNQRDYPISLQEFRSIFESNGFEVNALRYDTRELMGEFIAMAVASKLK
ncbi:MAG TPA: class I SAM-dependent methyltransferase [Gammaproteobacteria bacterium]